MSGSLISDGIIKPIVHYKNPLMISGWAKGTRAIITVIDHPKLPGERQVITTPILNNDDESGVFETSNTLYVPVEEK